MSWKPELARARAEERRRLSTLGGVVRAIINSASTESVEAAEAVAETLEFDRTLDAALRAARRVNALCRYVDQEEVGRASSVKAPAAL